MNVFNNHTLLPSFLPPDGGNWPWQVPLGPWPGGANNSTDSGGGTMTGHTIYLISQGIIHSTRLALSPVGTKEDIKLARGLYSEPWYLNALAAHDPRVVGHKLFFSHNYQLTAIEAYMDLYFLTGEQLLLDAVMGAWAMHRDPLNGWILPGGSLAINEGDIYEAGSFHLEAGTNNAAAHRDRAHFRERRAQSHEHAEHEHTGSHGHHHAREEGGHGVTWGGTFPTGEFCGAVFWLKLNQRLHLLDPDNETFVAEIEREVFNEGLAHIAPDGSGIRYFSFLNGMKSKPQAISTCCEGQGTRLYGSLNEYLFSTSQAGAYIDIYAPSSFTFTGGSLTVFTDFPYGSDVRVVVALDNPASPFDLALRIPSWTAAASVPILINDVPISSSGVPGSYLHLAGPWEAEQTISFVLPMALTPQRYTGVTQYAGLVRYNFLYGPTLLAFTPAPEGGPGAWNTTLGKGGMWIPGVDPRSPDLWANPAGDENPLHWSVLGAPGVLIQPNWEVQQTLFSAFPAFDQ